MLFHVQVYAYKNIYSYMIHYFACYFAGLGSEYRPRLLYMGDKPLVPTLEHKVTTFCNTTSEVVSLTTPMPTPSICAKCCRVAGRRRRV